MKLYLVMVPRQWTAGPKGGTAPRWIPVARYRYQAAAMTRRDELLAAGLTAEAHTVDLTSQTAPPELRAMSVPEVGAALRTSEESVYSLYRSGRLKARRIGKALWVDQDSLIAHIDRLIKVNEEEDASD